MSNQDYGKKWYRNERWEHEGLIRAIGFGGFLIVLGIVFALTPDLFQKISAFFNNMTTQPLPFSGGLGNLALPAPRNPAAHMDLYRAVMQFDIGIVALELVLLLMRLGLQRVHRVDETVGNIVFWGGAAFVTNTFLLSGTLRGWFEYWAALVVIVGFSIIIKGIVHFVKVR